MASVKWLERITLLDAPFTGFFQRDRYVIDGQPLRHIAPRAVLVQPEDGAAVERAFWVVGYAWSGAAPIVRVDLSRDGGQEWAAMPSAFLQAGPSRYGWTKFSHELLLYPGFKAEWSLMVRAVDAAGNEQPLEPRWNALGYGNNAVRPTRIRVRS